MARVNGDEVLDKTAGDRLLFEQGKGKPCPVFYSAHQMNISTKTRTAIDLTGQTYEEINVDGDSRCISFIDKAEGQELVIYLSEGQFVSLQSAVVNNYVKA